MKFNNPDLGRAVGGLSNVMSHYHTEKLLYDFEGLSDVETIKQWAQAAYCCLSAGVELMPLHHLSQWTGVRGVIETFPQELVQSAKDSTHE